MPPCSRSAATSKWPTVIGENEPPYTATRQGEGACSVALPLTTEVGDMAGVDESVLLDRRGVSGDSRIPQYQSVAWGGWGSTGIDTR